MPNLKEFQKKIKEKEEQRIGDIYKECVKRGCDLGYLKAVDTRVWLYPVKQTRALLALRNNRFAYNVSDHIRQWTILLQVLIALRPEHEKANEWKEALEILKDRT